MQETLMKKFFPVLLAAAAALVCFRAYAQDSAGTLTYVEGRVDRTQEGSLDYVPLVREESVRAGDVIRTKSHSKAEIRFADGSKVRLAEDTQMRIAQYDLGSDGKREKAHLIVDRGLVRAIVEKGRNHENNFL